MNLCNSNSETFFLVNKVTNEVKPLIGINAVRELIFSRLDMETKSHHNSHHPKNLSMSKSLEMIEVCNYKYVFDETINETRLACFKELVPHNSEVILTGDGKIFNYTELCNEYYAQANKHKIKYGRGYTYSGVSEISASESSDKYNYNYNSWAKPHYRGSGGCHHYRGAGGCKTIFPTKILSRTEKGQIRSQAHDIIEEINFSDDPFFELNIVNVDEGMVAKALSLRDRNLCYTNRSYTTKSWKNKKQTRQWMKRRRKNNTVRPMTAKDRAKLDTEMYNATVDNRSILPIIPFEE